MRLLLRFSFSPDFETSVQTLLGNRIHSTKWHNRDVMKAETKFSSVKHSLQCAHFVEPGVLNIYERSHSKAGKFEYCI